VLTGIKEWNRMNQQLFAYRQCVCSCTNYVYSSESYSFAKGEVFVWPVEEISVSEKVLYAME
jgi:hypothetical protein